MNKRNEGKALRKVGRQSKRVHQMIEDKRGRKNYYAGCQQRYRENFHKKTKGKKKQLERKLAKREMVRDLALV
jgi:hypothetical protein